MGPDSDADNYRLVIQRKVAKKWRKVDVVGSRGSRGGRGVVVVDLRRGQYRVVLPSSPQGPAVTSSTVRLRR